MTPERLTEQAFALLAEDGADWERYRVRLAGLTAAIRAYGEAQAAAQKERDAEMADEEAQEYSARHAVDACTADYLTGAETCARRLAALIRSHP